MGLRVGAMKPIESGCKRAESAHQDSFLRHDDTLLFPSDGSFLREVASMQEPLELVTPVRFAMPLAPLVAAQEEKLNCDLSSVMRAFSVLSGKYNALVVEGIGGLLVPLSQIKSAVNEKPKAYYVTDLIKEFNLPVIIVSRPSLGTINHTLLTVSHAISEGIDVAGIIINYAEPPEHNIAEQTNLSVLRKLSPAPILGIIPYFPDITAQAVNKIASTLPIVLP
jgi:dethiobiotin synthetase